MSTSQTIGNVLRDVKVDKLSIADQIQQLTNRQNKEKAPAEPDANAPGVIAKPSNDNAKPSLNLGTAPAAPAAPAVLGEPDAPVVSSEPDAPANALTSQIQTLTDEQGNSEAPAEPSANDPGVITAEPPKEESAPTDGIFTVPPADIVADAQPWAEEAAIDDPFDESSNLKSKFHYPKGTLEGTIRSDLRKAAKDVGEENPLYQHGIAYTKEENDPLLGKVTRHFDQYGNLTEAPEQSITGLGRAGDAFVTVGGTLVDEATFGGLGYILEKAGLGEDLKQLQKNNPQAKIIGQGASLFVGPGLARGGAKLALWLGKKGGKMLAKQFGKSKAAKIIKAMKQERLANMKKVNKTLKTDGFKPAEITKANTVMTGKVGKMVQKSLVAQGANKVKRMVKNLVKDPDTYKLITTEGIGFIAEHHMIKSILIKDYGRTEDEANRQAWIATSYSYPSGFVLRKTTGFTYKKFMGMFKSKVIKATTAPAKAVMGSVKPKGGGGFGLGRRETGGVSS